MTSQNDRAMDLRRHKRKRAREKKQTLDNFEANFLWFKHKIKLMGHGELRFTEREQKKGKARGATRHQAMAFCENEILK